MTTRLAVSRRSVTSPIAVLLAISMVASASSTAAAQRSHEGEKRVAACITRSAKGHAWLERTLWGLRDQEGGWIGAEIANADGSHDLGPLQINSWWVPRLAAVTGRTVREIRWWLKQDACFNVDAARWIFLSSLAATRDYWKAIGRYHSPTGWRQRRYAWQIASHLKRRFGPTFFASRPRP